jgi:hypothetical protein
MKFPALLQNHVYLWIILGISAIIHIFFPLTLQALEPYAYAAGIEGYYDFSSLFSLAAGKQFPDFARYHPNHPLGQTLAGLAYDLFHIPVLAWMQGINTLAGLSAGYFLYRFALSLRLTIWQATLAVALFTATHCYSLATLSGEWHMPAVALNLAGMWRLAIYLEREKSQHLFEAACLLPLAVSYHLNAFFILLPVGTMLLLARPRHKSSLILLAAATLSFSIIVIVYLVVPLILFEIPSFSEFLDFFFVYKELNAPPYSGLTWISISLQTFLHGFIFIYPGMPFLPVLVPFILVLLFFALMGLLQTNVSLAWRWLLAFIPAYWFIGHAFFGVRPDALNGWLFAFPYLSVVLVAGICQFHRILLPVLGVLVGIAFVWNIFQWRLPNYLQSPQEVFLFYPPELLSTDTPLAFVVYTPPLSFPEIWHAGSVLGFRNQQAYFPCCRDRDFKTRLTDWTSKNPNGIIISDGKFGEIEQFLYSINWKIQRLTDRTARWSADLTPSTVYIPLSKPLRLRKRIVSWRQKHD